MGSDSDYVTIYDGDGPRNQSTQIAMLTGNLGVFDISSTGNSLFVKFESDYYFNNGGFHATIHYCNPYLIIL